MRTEPMAEMQPLMAEPMLEMMFPMFDLRWRETRIQRGMRQRGSGCDTECQETKRYDTSLMSDKGMKGRKRSSP